MKIVLLGSAQRVGAREGHRVIDLNRTFARYLRERRGATSDLAEITRIAREGGQWGFKVGDVVEVTSSKIGTLLNRIVKA